MENLYIQRVLNGDHQAFSFLVRQHQDMGFGVAMSIVKDHDMAKDVVQDSFVKVYHALASFNQSAKFSSWFYTIVYRTALEQLKKTNRQWELEKELTTITTETSVDNKALEDLDLAHLRSLIKTTLKQLPPKEALAIQLFYLNEQSIKEIEEITKWSTSHIKTLLHRGRKHFYQLIDADKAISNFNQLDI